jgi:hypothetical protein
MTWRDYWSTVGLNVTMVHYARAGYAVLALFCLGLITWSLQHHPDWLMRYVAGWYQLCSLCFIMLVPQPNRSWFCWYLYRTLRVFSFYTLTSLILWVLVMLSERPNTLLKYTSTYYVPVVFVIHLINTSCLLAYYNEATIAPPIQSQPLYVIKYGSSRNTPVVITGSITSVYFLVVTIMSQWTNWYGLNLWEAAFVMENSLLMGWWLDNFLFAYCQESCQSHRHDYNPVINGNPVNEREAMVVGELSSDDERGSDQSLFPMHSIDVHASASMPTVVTNLE